MRLGPRIVGITVFVLLAGCHDFDALRGTGLDAGHDGAVDRDAEVDGGCGTAGSPDCIIRPSFINAYELATAGGPDILISVGETATWNTDTGEIDHGTGTEQLNPTVENQDADAPPRSVFTVDSLTVERGATLTFEGTNAVAILAVGEIGIAGRVVASAQALVGGPGGASSAEDASTSGLWVSSGRPGEFEEARSSLTFVVINEAWSGGGGASNASIGGEGGDASGNQLNTAPADAAGGDSGGSSPWPHSLVGGGAGGWGICGSGNGSPVPGGAGGGALLLASQTAIEIDSEGVIVAAGAGGRAPIDVAACPGPRGGSGGGGGAGGTIVLEAGTVRLDGGVYANGGGGGGGETRKSQVVHAMSGSAGTSSIQVAAGGLRGADFSEPVEPIGDRTSSASAGGAGAANTTGATAGPPAMASVGATGYTRVYGGGGGGGAGRIIIGTVSGTYEGGGETSPSGSDLVVVAKAKTFALE
ncbi:MAG: hypothetical protein R3A78_02555 [Polyangiales bacterium]